MKRISKAVLALGMAMLAAACIGARASRIVPDRDSSKTAPPITEGATLFHERGCAQCHQIRGVGGHKGPDLSGVGRSLHKPAIAKQIVAGGDAMPAFGEVLPADEIQTLVNYLSRCKDKIRQPKQSTPARAQPADPV